MSIIALRRPVLSLSARSLSARSLSARSRSTLSVSALSLSTLCAGALLLTGCGDGGGEQMPLTGLVLSSSSLPADYTVVPASVDDLITGNRRTLEQAASVAFTPPQCAPTADGAFNPQLNSDNTVLLVAQSSSATLSEVISTVRRDVDADRRATTGPCRTVTAVPGRGTLAGARIGTTTTVLPSPTGDAVEQALVVRSDSVTELPDGQVRVRSALVSNVLVQRPSGDVVTVQVNVGSSDGGVLPAAPEQIAPPMDEGDYLRLVQDAVARAAR